MNYQGKVIIEPQFEPQEDVVDILPRLGIPKRAYVVHGAAPVEGYALKL